MSSKGPTILGTDGNDFMHRQTVASHYQLRMFILNQVLVLMKIIYLKAVLNTLRASFSSSNSVRR
ncbi:hypothetical protein RND71_043523 [Anisodus tanguticus]|uniref:Uncharacterized protein n=1 Tax=Anisodus tanguticus TaxID=243964 RepID=A0AAE1QNP8_9SOLA|nr:hypothetical protein RND71_043523 [Anisodus tanguticus]